MARAFQLLWRDSQPQGLEGKSKWTSSPWKSCVCKGQVLSRRRKLFPPTKRWEMSVAVCPCKDQCSKRAWRTPDRQVTAIGVTHEVCVTKSWQNWGSRWARCLKKQKNLNRGVYLLWLLLNCILVILCETSTPNNRDSKKIYFELVTEPTAFSVNSVTPATLKEVKPSKSANEVFKMHL